MQNLNLRFIRSLLLLLLPIQIFAQGWWPANRYDKLPAATDPKKTANLNLFVDWVKKSYTPIASSLGSYQRSVGPSAYGVAFDTWSISKKPDANGQPKPEGETNSTFFIGVNQIPGSYPIYFINKTGQDYYFIWQPDGYAASKQFIERRAGADPRITPNAYPYITRVNDWLSVFLVPGNELPFTPVTQGELLDKAEANTTDESYRNKIRQLRNTHKATLNQQAIIRDMQPTMYSFETDPDIFDQNNWAFQSYLKQNYPVYKLTTATLEKCKAVQPMWISIWFPFKTPKDYPKDYAMYKAMVEHLNFTYIYNYFFAPEKVKGIAYSPK